MRIGESANFQPVGDDASLLFGRDALLGQAALLQHGVAASPVYGWFTERFDTADLREAKALLDELT